jgi:hypothetical protein
MGVCVSAPRGLLFLVFLAQNSDGFHHGIIMRDRPSLTNVYVTMRRLYMSL